VTAPSRTLRQLWPELTLVTLGIVLRVAMNASYDIRWSYDFDDHFAYVEWLSRHLGWAPLELSRESYHPPLYYAIAGLALRGGVAVQQLGWISIAAGCARLLLILVGVQRWLPDDRAAQLAALAIAAVLPASVHVDGMLTNEALNGLLCTAATLLAARWFAGDARQRWRRGRELGLVAGLALLVKVSALIILGAVAVIAAVEALRLRESRRARPLVAVAAAAAIMSGAWFAHNRATYGKWIVTSFDGADAPRAVGYLDAPYFRRRTLHFFVGFSPRVFVAPYSPTGIQPRAELATPLFASTFIDYYNYGYAPYPAELDSALRGNYKPLRHDVLTLSRLSVAGGALVAVAALAGWLAGVVVCWRRRDYARLVMLAVPLFALAGQVHFAVKYPIDSEGMVKSIYLQFAAAPLCATFGVTVAWLWRRRRWRALAIVELAAVAAVAVYAIGCRMI
jgi:hypothetical protein